MCVYMHIYIYIIRSFTAPFSLEAGQRREHNAPIRRRTVLRGRIVYSTVWESIECWVFRDVVFNNSIVYLILYL